MEPIVNKRCIFLIYVALVLATLIAFEPIRHNDFVDYDDNQYVTDNPHVMTGITLDSFIWAFTTPHSGNWHPLTWISHMLDCELFGPNPFWHHTVSLLFHIVNTLLLFGILKKMTGRIWPSAFVAAAFALHPLHVESVAWIAERKDVLSSFFWMLTIAAYIRYAERPRPARYSLVVLFLALGLMAKPMLVTLPFVLLLLDYWPLGRFKWTRQNQQELLPQSESARGKYHISSVYRLVGEKIPLFTLVAISSVITFITQKNAEAVVQAPLMFRISNALFSYVAYINKMIYPNHLAVLYPLHRLPSAQSIVFLVELAIASAVVIYMARSRRYLLMGWLWYLGTLLPVIGLIQIGSHAIADRYTYLPSIGIFIMVAWGIAELSTKWRYRKTGLAIAAGLVLTALLMCTRLQLYHWQNNFTLFGHAIKVTENNYIMHENYGCALLEKGRYRDAVKQFDQALRIRPRRFSAHSNKGAALLALGKTDKAITSFTEALRLKPGYPDAANSLGLALQQQGEISQAVKHFNNILKAEPDSVNALSSLAWILATTSNMELYNPAKAVKLAHRACELTKYKNPSALHTLAAAYASDGKFPQAIETAKTAIKLAKITGREKLMREAQSLLQLYQQGRAYRQNKPRKE